ncbi:hypothetical protein ACKI1I_03980 [Streptomyces turgidiscabies]|uniref:Uncharacterized protein n=1 Tax=Streptomyces turgidiscabies (strain Car8) TaxID=698760 RepID=L7FAC1_STRT8|nr:MULTISPECIES: hypothetical protein [Streptomyces]ELP68548.1 hypothetical protein STRTUCAR8_03526 [Streptomyces turgidiscabies Car8]MDX3494132.1 hypothetical protein [Streptomyces turgidiscabies]GAQ68497.1 hypothetical protein T45_00208 [Streptomyces turgidiscabies]
MRGVPRDDTRPPVRGAGNPRSARSPRGTAPPGRRPRGRHASRAATGAVLLLLATGTAPAFAASGGADSPERDAQLVYCLDPVHRTDLLPAAVRLGLLKADAKVSPERWAKDHDDDFGRACAALMAAESDSPASAAQEDKGGGEDGWLIALLKQLPLLLAGALLTLGGQSYERGQSERRSLRQELGTTESAYRAAVREYLAEYGQDERADHTAVRATRDALTVALSRVPGPSARRAEAERLTDALPLAEPLPRTAGRYLLDAPTRTRRANSEQESVDRCLRSLPGLDRTSLHWSWRAVRHRPVRPGAAGTGSAE